MNIVDSSGWLAYFADEPNARYFVPPLSVSALLVVPTITIYEVFKVILRESSENEALQAVVAMQKGMVVDLNTPLAIAASRLSLEHNLPMADSIILATAQEFKAIVWTQDSDFKNLGKVKYFPRKQGMAN
ncbi:MAG: VapC toxin family PIN domain ribonuclease [Nitrospira bacterium HGW-Nitrospira-1]|nr:MAG: VapC toxin family PIN domain ribonuclease [Nitrospira bacterium HGW-Nitrospira-1]